MALSVTHTTRPTSNSISALLIKRRPREFRPHGLFCKNDSAFSINAKFIKRRPREFRPDGLFSINAKFMFNSRRDSFHNEARPTVQEVLKEIRETQWQVNSDKGSFRVANQSVPVTYSAEAAMVTHKPLPPAADRPHKTSIVIGHDDGFVNFLFIVLSTFLCREINLSKLESSTPSPGRKKMTSNPVRGEMGLNVKAFQHVFYIDFEASMAETRVQNALAELQEFTTFMRVLGSYPADPKDEEN